MRGYIGIALSGLLLTLGSVAQTIHLTERYNVVKAENGLIIGWLHASDDRQTNQIAVYDGDGKALVQLDILRLVPEAKRATVHDVSARPGNLIAVAAVYRKSDETVPAATLLTFDFKGNLLKAVALAPSREAWRIAIDSESHIWTMTAGAGGLNPSEAPLVVGYSSDGSVLKEILNRSEFPLHSSETQENRELGASAFGHTVQGIWLWLPGSMDEVTFKDDGSSLERKSTVPPRGTPQRIVLTEGGTLLAQVWPEKAPSTPQSSFFFRSTTTKAWHPFYPPCSSCTLIGADTRNALFIKGVKSGGLDVYMSPLPE